MKTGLTVTNPPSMIQSTSLSDAAGRAQALQPRVASQASVYASAKNDSLSTTGIDQLRAALKSSPEIRADVVERGRALAADPSYPAFQIIRHVSAQIVNSPDLSNDPSES
jgi:2,4-dienoyl-CoA reductase-like NADH-dependent reductase (Old Yellow Enzyme family)